MLLRRQPRAVLLALTLLGYLLGVGHLAFEAHTLSASGQLVDADLLADASHTHQGTEWCAEAPDLWSGLPDLGCAVLASLGAAWWPTEQAASAPAAPEAERLSAEWTRAHGGLDLLAVAPKASPPRS